MSLFLILEHVQASSSSAPQQASYYGDPALRGDNHRGRRYAPPPPPPPGNNDNGDDDENFAWQRNDDDNDERLTFENEQSWEQQPDLSSFTQNRGPPPPPPIPIRGTGGTSSSQTAPPIHYQFQAKDIKSSPSAAGAGSTRRGRRRPAAMDDQVDDGVPITSLVDKDETTRNLYDDNDKRRRDVPPEAYASARRDAITIFMDRSMVNRWMVRLGAGAVGAIFVTFVGTSLTTKSWWTLYAWTGFWLFLVTSWFRTPYGELCRAAGFLLLETILESRHIRREYPTRPHLRALLGAGPRRPFPPTDNPWNYRPIAPDNVPFSMVSSLVAMTIVGSFCGGNVPMVPSWLGALVGAGFLALVTTRPNARGDLARATGMRVVATVQTLWELQKDLNVAPKFFKVASLLLDKLLILDRQHRLKDRLVAFLSLIYDQIMRLVQQVQGQQQQQQQRPPPRRVSSSSRDGPSPRGRGPPRDERRQQPPRGPPRPQDEKEEEYSYEYRRRPSRRDAEASSDSFRSQIEEHASDANHVNDEGPLHKEEDPKRRRGFFGF